MGDLVYNYLAQEMQGYFVQHFYDWPDHPPLIDDTSGMDGASLGYVSEQPTADFSIPSPLYVAKPPRPLYLLKIPSQEPPELPPFHPLTATFRTTHPGTPTASITSTRIGVPQS